MWGKKTTNGWLLLIIIASFIIGIKLGEYWEKHTIYEPIVCDDSTDYLNKNFHDDDWDSEELVNTSKYSDWITSLNVSGEIVRWKEVSQEWIKWKCGVKVNFNVLGVHDLHNTQFNCEVNQDVLWELDHNTDQGLIENGLYRIEIDYFDIANVEIKYLSEFDIPTKYEDWSENYDEQILGLSAFNEKYCLGGNE